jgi:hypothetical protein
MKIFYLYRKQDESGVSGNGLVAEGIVFSNGKIALTWLTPTTSVVTYSSMDDVEIIHGHGGKTVILWDDEDKVDSNGLNPLIFDISSGGNWFEVESGNMYLKPSRTEDLKKAGYIKPSEFAEQKCEKEKQERFNEMRAKHEEAVRTGDLMSIVCRHF